MLNNKDLLDNNINNLDVVWYGNEYGVFLGCVKQTMMSFKRVNPAAKPHYAFNYITNRSEYVVPKDQPHYLSGKEEKWLVVYTSPLSLPGADNFHTTRLDDVRRMVGIQDQSILNLPIVSRLIQYTAKYKK